MLKSWVHIFLSLWLINTTTYFHASNSADLVTSNHSTTSDHTCVKINSWTDCLAQLLTEEKGDSPEKTHKIKYQRRYVNSRSANDNTLFTPVDLTLFYGHCKTLIVSKANSYLIGVALRPSYYAFLFRLSPF